MDTTGHLTGMALYNLAEHPEIQDKLRNEIKSHIKRPEEIEHSEINKYEYLNAFINETLRTHGPAGNLIPRIAIKDHNLKDLKI
jgi:cytochrome P450